MTHVEVSTEADTPQMVSRGWEVLRWITTGLFALTLLAGMLIGVRDSSYSDLTSALQGGRVQEVQSSHHPGGPPTEGVVPLTLRWQDGFFTHQTVVLQAGSTSDLDGSGAVDQAVTGVVVGSLEQELGRYNADVEVTALDLPSLTSTVLGRELYGGAAAASLAVWLATLLLLVPHGPDPSWGTRWAWAWFLLSPLSAIAVPAYLLLGARPHQPGDRQLTGGWAFIIALVVLGGTSV